MSNWSEAMRQRVVQDLQCPSCGEQNRAGRKGLVDLDETGQGYCNACGVTFDVEKPYRIPTGG